MSRPDLLAFTLLRRGELTVEATDGAVYRYGDRAEHLDKRTGYGRVRVYSRPTTYAMAHRVVWISVHGLIPTGLQVNHINRRPWDNRIVNLELVAPRGNARHWHGLVYDAIGAGEHAIDPDWLQRLDVPAESSAVTSQQIYGPAARRERYAHKLLYDV